jgi:hypothetical protein
MERTRRYEMADFPPGTRMLIADRSDLDALLAQGEIRAVGKFRQLPGGRTGLPAVYVSRRAQPFHVRHRIALVVAGTLLLLAAGVAAVIAAVGMAWFVAGIILMAATVATLARYARGQGGHRSVSVTTTTKVNVR